MALPRFENSDALRNLGTQAAGEPPNLTRETSALPANRLTTLAGSA
jgi:hypothetical protein